MSPPTPSYPLRVLGIIVPDTPLITQSLASARTHSDDVAYNHIIRSWLYLHCRPRNLRRCSHPVRSMLGPNGTLVTLDKRFEVDSAYAARDFLKTANVAGEWDTWNVPSVWDAIALHTTVSIALHKELELVVTSVGIAADIGGPEEDWKGGADERGLR